MARPAQQRQAPLARLILAGIVLTGIPLLSLAMHINTAPDDRTVVLPASLSKTALGPRLSFEISTVSTDDLAGDNAFALGDVVYLHNATDGQRLLYPFAISHKRGARADGNISLRGVISDIDQSTVSLDFQFEDLSSHSSQYSDWVQMDQSVSAEISVNMRSVARLKAVIIDGQRKPYDLMEKPVLFGRTNSGAQIAPPT